MIDFNLDLNKEHNELYNKKELIKNMISILGHHNLDQLLHEDTWHRINSNLENSSRLYRPCKYDWERSGENEKINSWESKILQI